MWPPHREICQYSSNLKWTCAWGKTSSTSKHQLCNWVLCHATHATQRETLKFWAVPNWCKWKDLMTKPEICMFSNSVLMSTKLGIFTHSCRSFSGMKSVIIAQEWSLGLMGFKSEDRGSPSRVKRKVGIWERDLVEPHLPLQQPCTVKTAILSSDFSHPWW